MFNELTNEEMVQVDGGCVICTISVLVGCVGLAITFGVETYDLIKNS